MANNTFYELAIHVAPVVPEDEAAELAQKIKDVITDSGSEIEAEKAPEMRELAYEFEVTTDSGKQEFRRAQFGWMQFQAKSDVVADIEAALAAEADIIRYLLVKIDEAMVGRESITGEDDESDE